MKVKTDSNMEIEIREGLADTKTLVFESPVRQLGLTKKECVKLGTYLMSMKNEGITNEVRDLIVDGFFDDPRSFGEIKEKVDESVKRSSLASVLSNLCEREELERKGTRRNYRYCVPERVRNIEEAK